MQREDLERRKPANPIDAFHALCTMYFERLQRRQLCECTPINDPQAFVQLEFTEAAQPPHLTSPYHPVLRIVHHGLIGQYKSYLLIMIGIVG